jgi:uncharacterized protein (TIGR00730 family)
MTLSPSQTQLNFSLSQDLSDFLTHLSTHKQSNWIHRALGVLMRMTEEEIDRLDWKILTNALEDMEKGFQTFFPYRHIRKVTIFGSSRITANSSEYQLAVEFAKRITKLGFMILTGAGGGIMQAGNEGAGKAHSFGLNIQLPFEQIENPYIDRDKLINFKYFFTRKLFFLRESDAVALFPGGFGTQDEAFETITLCQTGKYGPAPLVLIDEPNGNYWQTWNEQIHYNILKRKLISSQDINLYTITNNLDVACETICNFYRVYHSSRYVGEQFVIRLNIELSDSQVEELNNEFGDILLQGKIVKSLALPEESKDETVSLPRLVFQFDQRCYGRLYQLIHRVNQFDVMDSQAEHPEQK